MSDSGTASQQSWLEHFIRRHGGVAGSLHLRSGPDELTLAAAVNIPEKVQQVVRTVPRGKGMAGLALERNAAISSCNIQTDKTGDVRPGARAVDAQAGVALPVHSPNGEVRAVVGIAFSNERDISDDELATLAEAASSLP
jgi:L-methionine (R)-S-oxide reductase